MHLNDNSLESVLRDSPNTPDILVVDDLLKTIVIQEVGCCFDMYCIWTCDFRIYCFKYQPLMHALTVGGYGTNLVVLSYGGLGHVHRLCVRELQIAGLHKNSTQIAKYCSVSAIIGSLHGDVISTHNITTVFSAL